MEKPERLRIFVPFMRSDGQEFKKKGLMIRALPKLAPIYHDAVELFSKRHDREFAYKGESGGAIMLQAVEKDIVTQRKRRDTEVNRALWEKQQGLCADCDESLGDSFEKGSFDQAHLRPRQFSVGEEGNAEGNLVLKCRSCHRRETEEHDMATRRTFHLSFLP